MGSGNPKRYRSRALNYDLLLDGGRHEITCDKQKSRKYQCLLHGAARYRGKDIETVYFRGSLIVQAFIITDSKNHLETIADTSKAATVNSG